MDSTATINDHHHDRVEVSKNFKKHVKLPPQSLFQHAYSVIESPLEVRIQKRQTFFNRETPWMQLPVYLVTNKGLLFIYCTEDSGYILRISSALKISFAGAKEMNKTKKEVYSAQIKIAYKFGNVYLRFDENDDLQLWCILLLAAHQPKPSQPQRIVASTSLKSVVSTKTIDVPLNEDVKAKVDEIAIHRYRCDLSREDSTAQTSKLEGDETYLNDTTLPCQSSNIEDDSNQSAHTAILKKHPDVVVSPGLRRPTFGPRNYDESKKSGLKKSQDDDNKSFVVDPSAIIVENLAREESLKFWRDMEGNLPPQQSVSLTEADIDNALAYISQKYRNSPTDSISTLSVDDDTTNTTTLPTYDRVFLHATVMEELLQTVNNKFPIKEEEPPSNTLSFTQSWSSTSLLNG